MKKILTILLPAFVAMAVMTPTYANTPTLPVPPSDTLVLYPNPVTDQLNIKSDATPDAIVQIYTATGEEIYKGRYGTGVIFFPKDAEMKYPARPAWYLLRITNRDGRVQVAKFIKYRYE